MNEVGERLLESLLPSKVGDLSQIDLTFLEEASEISDLGTIQEITGLSERQAARLTIKFQESKTGNKVRDLFCTRDARTLVKEVLTIIAGYGVTAVGKRALESLTPSINKEYVEKRFSRLSEFLQLFQHVGKGRMEEVLKALGEARFAKAEAEERIMIIASSEEKIQLLKKFGSHVKVEAATEAEIPDILAKESHVLSTRPFKDVVEITVLGNFLDSTEVCPQLVINYYVMRVPILQASIKISKLLAQAFGMVDSDSVKRTLSLLDGLRERTVSLEDSIQEAEDRINGQLKKLMARGGGMDDFRDLVEEALLELADELNLEEDEVDLLREGALSVETLPFSFSPSKIRTLSARRRIRRAQERYIKLRNTAFELEKGRNEVAATVKRLFELDSLLAITRFASDYDLHIPQLNEGVGIGFAKGRNLLLIQDQLKGADEVKPVSYSVGQARVPLFGAESRPIVMLTGANSGGKTTLLETLALIHILSLLGLPVPVEKADVPLIPLYLFRRRTVRKVGSLEYAIKVLRPVMTKRHAKLLLMDEFEALTEPGAVGRIVASILNDLPSGSLTLFVTHLARETLPHLKTQIRVDGIEAKGIDEVGNLIVDRQPIFNHLGTSTPHLIISRLLKRTKNKRLQKAYQDMIDLLETGQG
ncbi:hypothetical protein MUP77_02740 [Candidatus Bathyarchaeota archaeon]|nr:hypothetical protein [Candidatus Bathyarchaeota archaeon]